MIETLKSHPWLSQQETSTLELLSNKITEYELTPNIVVDWFSNFSDEKQFNLALKIFNLIDYRTNKKSIDTIKIYKKQIDQSMYKTKRNNIILVSSDEHGDSSNRFIYDIAKNWKLLESNIFRKSELNEEIINDKNNFFIFFNDTHGTGNQFVNEFNDIINSIGEENCAIISITMTDIALKRFNEEFPNIGLIQPTFQSTKNIKKHIDENSLTTFDLELLRQLGNDVYSKGALGYKDSGLLIAYSHQCPNNTLPIIWANGENNEVENRAFPWSPLFEYKKIKKKVLKKEEEKDEKYLTTIPPINPDFIGRIDELKEIKKNLNENKLIYIVNGIGGVGKSELSYEYFHQHKSKYKKCAFIELSSDELSLEEVFVIKFKDKFQLDNFDAIINRLQEFPEKNLFLIDNLERREDFEKLKALNTNFDLLITSRLTDIDTNHQLNLETLSPEDAEKLFLGIFDTKEDIKDILEYLDNHPLFINLCAKSLLRNYISLDELRNDIKNNNIYKIKSKDAKTFQEHLEKIFNKQFQNEKDKDLKLLLQKLSIFPSIEVSFDVYEKILNIKRQDLQGLVDKGWLIQKEDEYKLHQIIKTFIFSSYKPNYNDLTYIFENLSKFIDPDDSTIVASLLNNYIPIIESFLVYYENKKDIYISGLLDSLTYLYFSIGNYNKSLEIQEKSCVIKENLKEDDLTYLAKSFSLLGVIHSSKGKYDLALEWYEKSLKIREQVLGKNHPDTATIYNNIAAVYYSKGKYDLSLEWYEKSLKIREQVLGKNHPNTATIYNNIAAVYDSKGKYDLSLVWYEKSLKIREQVLGKNHPDTATTYNNIATVYDSKGKYDLSLEWYEKSLKIREQVLGENHPDTATVYNNMAFTYKQKKSCEKAKEFFEKALSVDYNQRNFQRLKRELKLIEKAQKQEKKAKLKDKGRFCKD
ncbi:MAG: tetratricopeptide repeat protein [Campylobacteraceae bacterium]|nr:tetratricopeptide repeat protein [Campylobacteraceae bacterium]